MHPLAHLIAHLLAVIVLLAACAQPVTRPVEVDYKEGESALEAGDLERAEAIFKQALANARRVRAGPDAESQILLQLARVQGRMCHHDDADKSLRDAVGVMELGHGSDSPLTVPARIELARFSHDIGRHAQAVRQFEAAIAIGGERLEIVDPHNYAAILNDYAYSLGRLGKLEPARALIAKAKGIQNRQGLTRVTRSAAPYEPYPTQCKKQD